MAEMMGMDDRRRFGKVTLDQLEWQDSDPCRFEWDAFAWYGGDFNKLWVETEGEHADGDDDARVEVAWDRIVSAWWSTRLGVRWDVGDAPTQGWAAFGIAGGFYGLAAVMVTAQLGSGVVQAGAGLNFAAITAAVVGGTQLAGGRGGVPHSMIGVLILTVLTNGLVLVGVSPYVQGAVQGVIVVVAVGATLWPLRHRLEVVK